MARKIQRTFYLEKDIMSFIEQYQEKYELSSISIALERVLLPLVMENMPTIKQQPIVVKTVDKPKNKLIDNIRNSMPE